MIKRVDTVSTIIYLYILYNYTNYIKTLIKISTIPKKRIGRKLSIVGRINKRLKQKL